MAHGSNHHRQHYFAPGAIEHHVYSRAHQRRALVRWLKRAGLAMACVLWFLAVFTAVASPAHAQTTAHPLAPTTVGLHLGSHHLGDKAQQWNNANHGVYARWGNGLTLGTLRNSLNRQGTYVAWTWERPVHERVSVAITAGVTSGYDRLVQDNFTGTPGKGQHTAVRCNAAGQCRTVLLRPVLVPLIAPSVELHITQLLSARVSFIPKTGTDADHALHLSAEWRF
jgi:hypothetical protein